jgi:ABC-type multidrug transport system ATPase subunit
MMVIASIHQPSTSTLLLFDNVLLLSEGKTVYFGPPQDSIRYFSSLGHPPSPLMSPAEFMLELTNTDFLHSASHDQLGRRDSLIEGWKVSAERKLLDDSMAASESDDDSFTLSGDLPRGYPRSLPIQCFILFHRMVLVLLPL